MKRFAIIAACLALAGCGHTAGPAPTVEVAGPRFAASEFECAPNPAPPDRQHRAARDAVKYHARQDASRDACAAQLESVGRKAAAAGLVN